MDWTEQFRTGSDINVIADDRRAFVLDVPQSNDDAIAYTAVVAELCIAAYHDAAEMIDDKITTNLRLAGQFNSGNDLHKLEKHVVDERAELSHRELV